MELGIWFHFWGILRMKSHHWLRFWKSELVLLIQFLLTNWNQNNDPNQVSAQHWFIRSNADFFFWAWYNKLGNLYWYKASIYIPGITLRAQTDIDIKVDIIASGHIQLVHSSILILIPVVLYTQVAPYGPPHSSILVLIPVLYTQVAILWTSTFFNTSTHTSTIYSGCTLCTSLTLEETSALHSLKRF